MMSVFLLEALMSDKTNHIGLPPGPYTGWLDEAVDTMEASR